jgi:hypothetical protein
MFDRKWDTGRQKHRLIHAYKQHCLTNLLLALQGVEKGKYVTMQLLTFVRGFGRPQRVRINNDCCVRTLPGVISSNYQRG